MNDLRLEVVNGVFATSQNTKKNGFIIKPSIEI